MIRLDEELAAIAGDPARPLASLSVLAIRDGRVVHTQQFGRARITGDPQRDRAAGRDTLYRIASISKLVTTLGVMKLVEGRKVSLDGDVSEVLGWSLRNPHFPREPITLRMMLSHTSSIRDEGGYYWPEGHAIRDALVPGGALYGEGRAWSREKAPGTWFSYANLPWGVIATVMEKASGERFDRFMRRHVLEPLGTSATFNPAGLAPADLARVATLYRKRTGPEGHEVWNPSGPWIAQVDDYSVDAPVPRAGDGYVPGTNGTLFGPQGGLRASAVDLGRVMRLLMGGGEIDGVRVLQAESVDAMLSQQWRYDGHNGDAGYGRRPERFQAWGLGVQRFVGVGGPGRGDRIVEDPAFAPMGHLGDAWGLTSCLAFDPRTRHGMVFLTGGSAFDPDTDPGRYSALSRFEERILTALWQRAILGRDP